MFGFGKKTQPLSFNDPRRFIGKRGVVSIIIKPNIKGQIAVCGTWYLAECKEDLILDKDVIVEIIDIECNTVYVKPLL